MHTYQAISLLKNTSKAACKTVLQLSNNKSLISSELGKSDNGHMMLRAMNPVC
jgi:hypothetical protein